MKKEYILFFAGGMFVLAYVLDAVVNPLSMPLATPYHYFTPEVFSQYAFTTTSIIIKALAIVSAIVVTISYVKLNRFVKSGILLAISGLMQLYALQDITTNSQIIPLTWSLSLTLAGLLLLIPMIIYILLGIFGSTQKRLEESIYGTKEDQIDLNKSA